MGIGQIFSKSGGDVRYTFHRKGLFAGYGVVLVASIIVLSISASTWFPGPHKACRNGVGFIGIFGTAVPVWSYAHTFLELFLYSRGKLNPVYFIFMSTLSFVIWIAATALTVVAEHVEWKMHWRQARNDDQNWDGLSHDVCVVRSQTTVAFMVFNVLAYGGMMVLGCMVRKSSKAVARKETDLYEEK